MDGLTEIETRKCDDCLNKPAVIRYPGDTVTYYFCLECASLRADFLRQRLAYLTKAIRKVKSLPETWQGFLKEQQTS